MQNQDENLVVIGRLPTFVRHAARQVDKPAKRPEPAILLARATLPPKARQHQQVFPNFDDDRFRFQTGNKKANLADVTAT